MSPRYEAYLDFLERNNLDDCQDAWDQFESAASDWAPKFDAREEARGER